MSRSRRSDAELILASRLEPAAFRELYDRWRERLLAYFIGGCSTPTSPLICSPRHFGRVRTARSLSRRGSARRHLALRDRRQGASSYFRRRSVETRASRRLGLERPELDAESTARIEALEDDDRVRASLTAAMCHLSGRERDAVELRVVAELGYEQIAARLDCSEAAARTRVHRALARLNDLMEAKT